MRELIIQLFKEFGFVTDELQSDIMFFRREVSEKIEYYLVMFLNKNALGSYQPSVLQPAHELLQGKKKTASDIEKNTSLLLCVEFEQFERDCRTFKNIMLRIEEDEYWFKKYVLPFTQTALEPVILDQPITSQLNRLVANDNNFEAFSENIYRNEPYFFSIQLFLKLPFLNLAVNTDTQFTTITQLLGAKLSTAELHYLHETLIPFVSTGQRWDQLLANVVNPQDDTFDTFFNNLDDHATS